MNKKKPFCPILMIGFDPPEKETDTDPRVCNINCNWYNRDDKCCLLQSLHEDLTELIDYTCAATVERRMEDYDIDYDGDF